MLNHGLSLISGITLKVASSGLGSGMVKPFNDIAGMLMTFGASLPNVYYLIGNLSYLCGVLMIGLAIHKLRKTGDHQSHMVNPGGLGGPLANMLLGAALIWWPVMLDSMTYTLWGTTSPLTYTPALSNDYSGVWTVILGIMKIVGLIAFVKGWYLLSKAGEQGGHGQGMVGKGIVHIIGGVLAYHIDATIQLFLNTFGWS